MSYKQLVQPNLNQTGVIGGCLAYAREMFGAPGGVTYAWEAWENAKYKYEASDLPTDAAVLMWYSYTVDGKNEGHVTVNVPGKGIYSSPYAKDTSHAVVGSIADVERIYGVTYVGWSEDINGVRVAEPVAPPAPPPAPSTKMPAVGTSIQLVPTQTRTTYKAGTTTVAGHIKVTNDEYVYEVRGYDSKYPGRIIINSTSGGGNGVALALLYTNGSNIGAWKEL